MGFKRKVPKETPTLVDRDIDISKALSEIAKLADSRPEDISLRGISVSLKDDGSWMGVLRVRVGKYAVEDGGNLAEGWQAGDYVSIVNAGSFTEALALIEVGLEESTLELSADKFSSKQGKPQQTRKGLHRAIAEAKASI